MMRAVAARFLRRQLTPAIYFSAIPRWDRQAIGYALKASCWLEIRADESLPSAILLVARIEKFEWRFTTVAGKTCFQNEKNSARCRPHHSLIIPIHNHTP
jgi:hypothetical protein